MSYKDTKDKTDRACRDAVRKLEKTQTKYRAAATTLGDSATTASTTFHHQPPTIELSLADVFSSAGNNNNNYSASAAAATTHSSPLLAVLASSAAVGNPHHTSPAALADPLSMASIQQEVYRNPGLEHSCGSLLLDSTVTSADEQRRTSTTTTEQDALGGTMEFSTTSLEHVILRDVHDEKKEEDEVSIEYGAALRHGSILSASTQNIAAAADSIMSLDLCSIETDPPAPGGVAVSTGSCTAEEAGSSLREDHSDVTLRTTTSKTKSVPKTMVDEEDDEDMLIESFHRSLDFRE